MSKRDFLYKKQCQTQITKEFYFLQKKKEKTMKLTFSVKLLPLILMAYEWNAAKGSWQDPSKCPSLIRIALHTHTHTKV